MENSVSIALLECRRLCISKESTDGLSGETLDSRLGDSAALNLIKYTGSAVNTIEKYDELRGKYFTDGFIERVFAGFDSPTSSGEADVKPWEENGAVYKFCFEGGNVTACIEADDRPALDEIYVRGYDETEDKIHIRVMDASTGNDGIRRGVFMNYTLEKQPDGGFRLDSITYDGSGNTVYIYDESKHLYRKTTLNL